MIRLPPVILWIFYFMSPEEINSNKNLESIIYLNEEGVECTEEWRDIPLDDFIGRFQVSDLGRVKSLGKGIINSKEQIYSLVNNKGYKRVKFSIKGKEKAFKVHQIVAMAFLGHIPDGMKSIIDHININKEDNRVSNLRIVSIRENNINSIKRFENKESDHIGVRWHKTNKIWFTSITINKIRIHLTSSRKDVDKVATYYKLAVENMHKFDGCDKTFRELIKSLAQE